MQISDEELRAMVRDAVARFNRETADVGAAAPAPGDGRSHASHALLTLVRGGDADGRCLIEPAVRCNHCGYCQSMGH